MTPSEFYTLIALSEEERHGYVLIDRVNALSGERLNLATGSIYRVLRRLRASGLIVEVIDDSHARNSDSRRRFYRLTAAGIQAVHDERRRMEQAIELSSQTEFTAT